MGIRRQDSGAADKEASPRCQVGRTHQEPLADKVINGFLLPTCLLGAAARLEVVRLATVRLLPKGEEPAGAEAAEGAIRTTPRDLVAKGRPTPRRSRRELATRCSTATSV